MNELSKVSIFIVERFKNNPMVNTITFEKSSEIDHNKTNIYPLVNVDLIDSDPISGMLTFNYIITILQQRDFDKQINNDKIFDKDNMFDNLNECYSIATRFINGLEFLNNDQDIDISRKSNVQMMKDFGTNQLDGVRFTISLIVKNETPC